MRALSLAFCLAAPFALLTACGGTQSATGAEGCACAKGKTDAEAAKCTSCAKGKAGETVWCDHCKSGFVDGKRINCPKAFAKAKAAKEGTAAPCDNCPKPCDEKKADAPKVDAPKVDAPKVEAPKTKG